MIACVHFSSSSDPCFVCLSTSIVVFVFHSLHGEPQVRGTWWVGVGVGVGLYLYQVDKIFVLLLSIFAPSLSLSLSLPVSFSFCFIKQDRDDTGLSETFFRIFRVSFQKLKGSEV